MTYLEHESLEAKAQINNDFDKGYDDAIKNKAKKENATTLYNHGFKLGSNYKGE